MKTILFSLALINSIGLQSTFAMQENDLSKDKTVLLEQEREALHSIHPFIIETMKGKGCRIADALLMLFLEDQIDIKLLESCGESSKTLLDKGNYNDKRYPKCNREIKKIGDFIMDNNNASSSNSDLSCDEKVQVVINKWKQHLLKDAPEC